MQKIVPHLWFDKEAREAAAFYVDAFGGDSKVGNITTLHNTPSGDTDIVPFRLWGYEFMSMSAGPLFKFTPAISFMLGFSDQEELDALWGKLSEGGKPLMPIDKYPFSDRYGWIQDKYGLSWQLILTKPEGDERPRIVPSMMFAGDNNGKAQEAINFYLSIFKDSKLGNLKNYPPGMEPDKESSVMYGDFQLENQWFAAMDSGRVHDFTFNEAISLIINCENQEEIDYYWKLSAVPESEQCGWLKDKYGVSWQVTARAMDEMLSKGTQEQIDRVTQAFLPMKKFDLAALQKAYEGK